MAGAGRGAAAPGSVAAWAASDVAVARKAISTGGGTRASASYAARDTTGQSAIGMAQGAGTRLRAGFWARVVALPGHSPIC